MKILIASIILVGFCVFCLCFNIIFRKNGQFPEKEIERNKDMRKMGIICAQEQERKMWGKKKNRVNSCPEEACEHCGSSCVKF